MRVITNIWCKGPLSSVPIWHAKPLPVGSYISQVAVENPQNVLCAYHVRMGTSSCVK